MRRDRPSADLSRWPLIGREDELAMSHEAVSTGAGLVLTGPPGVGKTRLAHEVLAHAAVDGRRVEWIAATESAARVPLGAVAHLVPSSALRGGRDATLRAIVAAFEGAQKRGPLLLGVDDAHLLDDGSAALVHLLATTGAATVVATVRSGERVPDSIVALWKDGPATVIALQALARSEVDAIVTAALDGPIEGSLLHLLWEASGGNALYLRELVRHGIESDCLRCDRGLWRWHGRFDSGERLQDLVAMRMGSLDETEWATLEVVSIGEPLPIDCLRRLGLDDVARRLGRRGLLASRRRGTAEITVAHPLFGEVVRARMPATRLDEVRLNLANALEATTDSPAEEFRIVLWRADAGDRSRPDQLRAAARRAWSLWAPSVAESLARAALESGPDLEAGYLLGEALHDQGLPEEALSAWQAVEDLPGPDRIRALLAVGQASALKFHGDRVADAITILRRAASRVDDPGAQQVLQGALAFFEATTSHGSDSNAPVTAGDAPSAALAAALRQSAAGHLEAAVRSVDEAIARADSWSDEFPTVALMLLLARQWARLLGGHVLEVEAEAERRYAAAIVERVDYPRVSWCLVRGLAAICRGRPQSAMRALREGVEVIGGDDRGFLRPMHAYLSMAAALAGDIAGAESHERRAEECNRATEGLFAVDVHRARGWVRAARGELTAAAEEASVAADLAAANNQAALEVLALHDVARFGRASDIVDRMVDVAGRVEGALATALVAHVVALAGDHGTALDVASTDFETLGFDLFAAEASAAAARAYWNEGRKASAYASRHRARAITEQRCDSARTPALVGSDVPVDLTGREREVAELAAAGMASRVIAERLGITTRTVDNLLGRVYFKLAVTGRRDLVEVLRRAPSA